MKTDATPYLAFHGIAQFIELLNHAFVVEERAMQTMPDGRVINSQVRIGNSMVMMGEKPKDQKPWPTMLCLYVEDADALYRRVIQAGRTGTSQRPNSRRRGNKAARNSSIRTAKRISNLSANRIRSGVITFKEAHQ